MRKFNDTDYFGFDLLEMGASIEQLDLATANNNPDRSDNLAEGLVSSGSVQTGTAEWDYLFGDGTMGGPNHTQSGGLGHDILIGDYGNFFSANVGNNSIATATDINASTFWYTNANPLFSDSTEAHTTIHLEGEGGAEYYLVSIDTNQTITIDIDFANFDTVVQILDIFGNEIFSSDDSLSDDVGDSLEFGTLQSFLTYTAPANATLIIRVGQFNGDNANSGVVSTFENSGDIQAGQSALVNVSVTNHAATGTPADFNFGDDTLTGGGGEDLLFGMDGNDSINGGVGVDYLDGGNGTDTVSYAGDLRDVTVDLSAGTGEASAQKLEISSQLTTVDVLNDAIAGNIYFNVNTSANPSGEIRGQVGAVESDAIFDDGSRQVSFEMVGLDGGQEVPAVTTDAFGTATLSFFLGTDGSVTVTTIINVYNVASGVTITASNLHMAAAGSNGSVVANLGSAYTTITETDTLLNMENIIGGEGDDTLLGDSSVNDIDGGAGDDVIDGGAGDDMIDGGAGNDTIIVVNDGHTRTIDGGTGEDELDLSGSTGTGWTITATTATSGSSIINGLATIEELQASNLTDMITEGNIDRIFAGGGDDMIITDGDNQADEFFQGQAGIDTLDFSADTDDITFNLTTGVFTGTAGALAFENAIAGSGNDTLIGTSAVNNLQGGDGNDTLDGGAGTDTLTGGAGDDTYIVNSGSDIVIEAAAEGTDEVQAFFTYSIVSLVNIENLTLTGTSDIDGTGNAADNVITGNSGDNILDGGAGVDTLIGGDGDDTYIVDNIADVVVEATGAGDDEVLASVTYSVSSALGINTLTLTGTADIDGTGNQFDNLITGNSGNNLLNAAAGNDTVNGLDGNDTLNGANGNDTLNGGAGDDVVNGGNGNDILIASSGMNTFNGGADNDTLDFSALTADGTIDFDTGTAVFGGVTNSFSNIENFIGGAGNDVITGEETFTGGINGGAGDDRVVISAIAVGETLDGGAGVDTLQLISGLNTNGLIYDLASDVFTDANSTTDTILNFENVTGGGGDEAFIGNSAANVIEGGDGADTIDGGAGNDTASYAGSNAGVVISLRDSTASGGDADGDVLTDIENLVGSALIDNLSGDNGINVLEGGGGDDVIVGFDGDDILSGGAGNDTLRGQGDNDMLSGGAGNDTVLGGLGDDTQNGDAGDDFMNGQGGDDIINGGDGIDTLLGASGNDTLNGDGGDDDINGNGGNDAINGGDGADTLNGAIGFDTINGGDGADIISGGNQNDTLSGDAGNDTLNGDAGNDIVNGGVGDDTLTGAAGADVLNGDDGNDNLSGSSGGDDLFGGAGADTLNGGGGNDDLNGGAGADTFVANTGFRTDRVQDFENGTDLIDFSGNSLANDFADVMAAASQAGTSVRIELNVNNILILEGVNLADLDASDFIF